MNVVFLLTLHNFFLFVLHNARSDWKSLEINKAEKKTFVVFMTKINNFLTKCNFTN